MKAIPTQELLDDRMASLVDIKACELAIFYHIKEYSGGNVATRLEINREILSAIDAELARRIQQLCENVLFAGKKLETAARRDGENNQGWSLEKLETARLYFSQSIEELKSVFPAAPKEGRTVT